MDDSTTNPPLRRPPLTLQVQELLAARIYEGYYPPNAQLPPEHELAAEFGISRATLRSALSNLATLGLVLRRHGAGTFVTNLPRITNPIDQAIDFQELIARSLCCPGVQHIYCALQPASAEMAECLAVEEKSPLLVSHKIFTADERPMIFCVNSLPGWLFTGDLLQKALDSPASTEPIQDFLLQQCGQKIENQHARLRPALAKDCTFHIPLPLEPDTPVLIFDEVAYNSEGRPLFHTYEYHPENQMSFEIVRRWKG